MEFKVLVFEVFLLVTSQTKFLSFQIWLTQLWGSNRSCLALKVKNGFNEFGSTLNGSKLWFKPKKYMINPQIHSNLNPILGWFQYLVKLGWVRPQDYNFPRFGKAWSGSYGRTRFLMFQDYHIKGLIDILTKFIGIDHSDKAKVSEGGTWPSISVVCASTYDL